MPTGEDCAISNTSRPRQAGINCRCILEINPGISSSKSFVRQLLWVLGCIENSCLQLFVSSWHGQCSIPYLHMLVWLFRERCQVSLFDFFQVSVAIFAANPKIILSKYFKTSCPHTSWSFVWSLHQLALWYTKLAALCNDALDNKWTSR